MDPVLDKDTANAARGSAAASSRPAATLVEGNIARTLIVFSLPILGSNVLQSINASINTAWIGQLLGPRALTASANANSILFFLLSISFGLSLAATSSARVLARGTWCRPSV
jgi:Na+-driven multidrug efflux pump